MFICSRVMLARLMLFHIFDVLPHEYSIDMKTADHAICRTQMLLSWVQFWVDARL